MTPEQPRLGVVLVNWNRWADTIECLESLLRSTAPLSIVVVDNGSSDGSLDYIRDWAAGTLDATPVEAGMARFSQPPLPKPIAVETLSAAMLPELGPQRLAEPLTLPALTLIDAGANLGFAGGNNLGLKLLLASPVDRFWLLNNDTVVDPLAAAALLARMDATYRIGMCGTVVRYYHRPGTLQALNGSRFNWFTGQSRGLGAGRPVTTPFNPARIAEQTDFVLGASLGVSRAFLQSVGLMEESYFLYFEEIDWAVRGRGAFTTAFAHGAIVYHKEGGSIGSSGVPGARSGSAEYWLTRSRLGFIRRHQIVLLPWHWLLTLLLAARRVTRGQFAKAGAMVRALIGVKY